MEGDKVTITSEAREEKGEVIYTSSISEKPQFMLNEEYEQIILNGIITAIHDVCIRLGKGENNARYASYIRSKID